MKGRGRPEILQDFIERLLSRSLASRVTFQVCGPALPMGRALIVVTISLYVGGHCWFELETRGGEGKSTVTKIHQDDFLAISSTFHFWATVELTPPPHKWPNLEKISNCGLKMILVKFAMVELIPPPPKLTQPWPEVGDNFGQKLQTLQVGSWSCTCTSETACTHETARFLGESLLVVTYVCRTIPPTRKRRKSRIILAFTTSELEVTVSALSLTFLCDLSFRKNTASEHTVTDAVFSLQCIPPIKGKIDLDLQVVAHACTHSHKSLFL